MIVRTALLLLGMAAASPALTHTGLDVTHGFASGMVHPLLGLDHVLAMGAVGLWAGATGGRAIWAWPAAFIAVMVLGALAGIGGLAHPGVEIAIALSVLLAGAAAALRVRASAATGAIICAVFAAAHGYAHGAELPANADMVGYMAGFVAATAALLAAGIAIGAAFTTANRPDLARWTGGAVAAAGLVLLLS
jgi:urease accessory protein